MARGWQGGSTPTPPTPAALAGRHSRSSGVATSWASAPGAAPAAAAMEVSPAAVLAPSVARRAAQWEGGVAWDTAVGTAAAAAPECRRGAAGGRPAAAAVGRVPPTGESPGGSAAAGQSWGAGGGGMAGEEGSGNEGV